MVDYLCIIQARINSSRLPAKVMLDLAGKTLLERVHDTISKSKKINTIVVATSSKEYDDIIESKLNILDIPCFRGDLNNVLKRFYDTAKHYKCKHIIRVTADNPLMDAKLIDNLINAYNETSAEYCMFTNGIYGLSAEIFSFDVLKKANLNARNDFDKEHVTPYIKDMHEIHLQEMKFPYNQPNISVTIDTLEDYIKMQGFYLYCQTNRIEPDIDNFIRITDESN